MGKVLDWLNGKSKLTKEGLEIPDPRPLALPVGFEKPEPIQAIIRRLVTDPAIRAEIEASGSESFDDADDFDIPDDLPQSPHEDRFDPLHLLAREQEINSGTVSPRSEDEIAVARKAIEDYRKAQEEMRAVKPSIPAVGHLAPNSQV